MTLVLLLCFSFAAIGNASAHAFNHADRHEVCDVYGDPNSHGLEDGHIHYHHVGPAPTAHEHDGVTYAAGHTHPDVFHDPCNQAGMARLTLTDAAPIQEISIADAALYDGDDASPFITAKEEAFLLPVPEIKERNNLILVGDQALAAQGFPGDGSKENPYIIEGYFVRNTLQIKDTSDCVVVRNNIVWGDALDGPIADLDNLVDNVAKLVGLEAEAEQLRAALEPIEAELNQLAEEVRIAEQNAAAAQAQEDQDADALATAKRQLNDAIARQANLQAEFDALELTGAQLDRELEALEAELEQYLGAQIDAKDQYSGSASVLREAVGVLETTLSESTGTDADKQASYENQIDELKGRIDAYDVAAAQVLEQLIDAKAATEAAREPIAALEAALGSSRSQSNEADAALAAAQQALSAAQIAAQPEYDLAARAANDAAQFAADTAGFAYSYAGTMFENRDQLARDLLGDMLPKVIEENADKAGRLILDWNGQCVHAYNNVVKDLRVNRNNIRTGFATGGLIEDNRILAIGQIRHYDGEFRENEVGDRKVVEDLLAGKTPAAKRTINTDGFNEAFMHSNVIYGSIDLDYHGHHHGAGFFSRESHYHGSNYDVAYMVDGKGGCKYAGYSYNPGLFERLVGEDPFGDSPEPLGNSETNCLPHMDHSKRWTSVRFVDNVIIDPASYGLRYEDRNHQGDDRVANSEDMDELNMPHFHQTAMELAGNTVVGSIWLDVFNADGIDVWSDDYSKAKTEVSDGLAPRYLELAKHPGAEVVNSHPQRNNAWVDIVDNKLFFPADGMGLLAAIQVNHAKELDLLDIDDNLGFALPKGAQPDVADRQAFLAFLAAANAAEGDAIQDEIESWGTSKDGAPRAVRFNDLKDSYVEICDNDFFGFTTGIEAWTRVYNSNSIKTCSENDFDGAANKIRFSTPPQEKEGLTDPIQDAAGDIDPRLVAVVDPAADYVDKYTQPHKDNAERRQADLERMADDRVEDAENYVETRSREAENRVESTEKFIADRL